MSHFATVQTRITDLACLKQALADLGHAVEEGAAAVRGYRGAREKADLVAFMRSLTGKPMKVVLPQLPN